MCGENGAGKSTLMKILSGAIQKTSGEIYLEGQSVSIGHPHDAKVLGISTIYQELVLNPNLSIAENMYLGKAPKKASGLIDWSLMYREAAEICGRIKFHVDVRIPVKALSVAEMQMVEIAKALTGDSKIIIMDEPTAALTNEEIDSLFSCVRDLKHHGVTIIYISHRLEEIFTIADRVTVLRDGKLIGTREIAEIDKDLLIEMMVGRELNESHHIEKQRGDVLLDVRNICRAGTVNNVSFKVYSGEVLGIAGLVGSGRTELVRAIFNADRPDSGDIYLNGEKLRIRSILDAINAGISLVPEDRKQQGLVLGMGVHKNTTLVNLKQVIRNFFINRREEAGVTSSYIQRLKIKTPSIHQKVVNLSGGNQQKVVLAKWLFSDPKVIMFDEPTRGIDVGAKAEIYELINSMVGEGIGIVIISSELPEILGICDRVLVMHNGSIAGELDRSQATQEKILRYAAGLETEQGDIATALAGERLYEHE